MPEKINEIVNTVIVLLAIAGTLFLFGKIIYTIFRNKYAKVKTAKAKVIAKNVVETFSKYSGNGKSKKYVIVFEVNGKKRSFYVSEFSYGGYRVGEKGTLKYQGDRLIDFD